MTQSTKLAQQQRADIRFEDLPCKKKRIQLQLYLLLSPGSGPTWPASDLPNNL